MISNKSKKLELQAQQNKSDEHEDVRNQSAGPISTSTKDNDNTKTSDNNHTVSGPSQTEVRTLNRKRTIIDYKKFLEEYADEPPSPPKKKKEVDLKRKPSKSRIAAEKYSRSKFATKPTHLPRPVHRGKGKGITPAASGSVQSQTSNDTLGTTNPVKTTTVPATLQEMQEVIKALLLLGNPPEQGTSDLDDNETLMLITGPQNQDVPPVHPAPPVVNFTKQSRGCNCCQTRYCTWCCNKN